MWDISGCSTEDYPSGEFGQEYISEFSLVFFDMIILTTSSRESEIAASIYKHIKEFEWKKYNPKIRIVRTKIDEVTFYDVNMISQMSLRYTDN